MEPLRDGTVQDEECHEELALRFYILDSPTLVSLLLHHAEF